MPQAPSQVFDVNAARQSGASDDDILDYLRQRSPNFDLAGALQSGAKKADIIDYLSTNSDGPSSAQSGPSISPDLLKSRQQMSAAEANQNMPQRTVGSAVREGLLGIPDALGITGGSGAPGKDGVDASIEPVRRFGQGLYNLGKMYVTGDAQGATDLVKGTASAVVNGPSEMDAGIRENDPDKFMHGLTGTATVTAPTLDAAGNVAKAGIGALSEPGVFSRTPENLLKRVMPNVELEHLQRGGSDLKAAEAATGKPITDVPSALAAEEYQAGQLNDQVNKIIDPQRKVVVPGSRARFIDEQIKQIPDDIRLHDPARYQSIIDDLNTQRSQPDMTIGDINDARVSANKLRRSFYNSKVGVQLAKDEQLNSALLAGRENAAQALLNEGMDQVGLGGSGAVRNLTQRLGSMIKVKEGLSGLVNKAELQAGTPTVSRFGKQAAGVVDKLKGNPEAFDQSLSVNDDIANAFRNWKGTPANFSMRQPSNFTRGLQPSKGQQSLQQGMAPNLFGINTPQGQPTGPQGSLRFGGKGVEQSPAPQPGQQSFTFPKTAREQFLEDYFKKNPDVAERTQPPRRFSPK